MGKNMKLLDTNVINGIVYGVFSGRDNTPIPLIGLHKVYNVHLLDKCTNVKRYKIDEPGTRYEEYYGLSYVFKEDTKTYWSEVFYWPCVEHNIHLYNEHRDIASIKDQEY